MNRLLIPLPLLASLLAGIPAAAQTPVTSSSGLPSRTLTVSAGADVRAVPDRGVVQLGVQTRASNAQTAMANNNAAMAKVVDALKQLGIPDANLQTSSITLSPVYSTPPPQNPPVEPQLIGFDASNTVTAETDPAQVGPAIDAAVAAGANQILSISFRVADDQPYRLMALQQAGALAKAKAQALATGLGVTLGDVDAAIEGSVQVTPVYSGVGASPTESAAVPVLPGQIILHTDVQVRFTLK